MVNVTNKDFLRAIFGKDAHFVHVTAFPEPPDQISTSRHMACWMGGHARDYPIPVNTNQYFTISTFYTDAHGKARRRKALYLQTYCLVLDDVREKLSAEQAAKLPPPSWILETSPGSEQWGYILLVPCTVAAKIDNLNDGLIASALAPDGKDPGQKGITRYVRLPEGINNKASKFAGQEPFKCRMLEWHPERKIAIEDLAAPFDVDLDAERREGRVDGAADVPDHPLLEHSAIHIKEIRSDGRFDITCPWVSDHTDSVDNGSAIFTNSDGSIGFKCHHGACQEKTGNDLLNFVEQTVPTFRRELNSWKFRRTLDLMPEAPVPPVDFMGAPQGAVAPIDFMGVSAPAPTAGHSALLDRLNELSATNRIGDMEKNMLNSTYVVNDMALSGQITLFYGPPNTGKTLFFLHFLISSIEEGRLNAGDLYYINADDSYKGLLTKAKLADKYGFSMISPSEADIQPTEVLALLMDLASQNLVNGKVIVLDTLKKFTDMMNKKAQAELYAVLRTLTTKGATVVIAGHVNKNPSPEGKLMYEGTADTMNDIDCAYAMYRTSLPEDVIQVVEFRREKDRGDVVAKTTYQYRKEAGQSYESMLSSVEQVDAVEAVKLREAVRVRKDREKYEKERLFIMNLLADGEKNQTAIITARDEAANTIGDEISRRNLRSALEALDEHDWVTRKGKINNATFYRLIDGHSDVASAGVETGSAEICFM